MIYYFGDVEFLIDKYGASTIYGYISFDEIKKALKYINNPPTLANYPLTIHNTLTKGATILNDEELCKFNNLTIGFGCQKGTLSELTKIYKEIKALRNYIS
jgi:hypothetical protein